MWLSDRNAGRSGVAMYILLFLLLHHVLAQQYSIDVNFGTAYQEVIELNDVEEPTHVLIDWESDVSVTDQQENGLPDVVLAAEMDKAPVQPRISGEGCSRYQPCFDARMDALAFAQRTKRAALGLKDVGGGKVYVHVWNFDRGRKREDGSKVRPALSGTLRVKRVEGEVCGGLSEEEEECMGRGRCEGGCRCDDGWGGRFCERKVEEKPKVEKRPANDLSNVEVLEDSAVVKVEQGRTFKWDVAEGKGKVLVRARVLLGSVALADGGVVGEGGGVGLYAKEGNVPEEGDFESRGRILQDEGVTELVVLGGKEGGEWYVWVVGNATVGVGDAGVSLKVERCEGRDCPFEEGWGVGKTAGIAVGVVGGAILVALCVLCVCCRERWWRGWGKGRQSGVWDGVEVRRLEVGQMEGGRAVREGDVVGYLGRSGDGSGSGGVVISGLDGSWR